MPDNHSSQPAKIRYISPKRIGELFRDLAGIQNDAFPTTTDIFKLQVEYNRLKIMKNPNDPLQDNIQDMTEGFKGNFGVTKFYKTTAERYLAEYAITIMLNQYGTVVRDMQNAAEAPSTETIPVDVAVFASVYQNVLASIVIEQDGQRVEGMLQTIYIPSARLYRVSICGKDKASVNVLESVLNNILEYSNFFQGKSLRFSNDGVVFIPTPDTSLEEAVLPDATIAEYKMNVVEFLTNTEMQAITKKRSLLLHGPPGTGKTTSIKALFNLLHQSEITCIYVSDDSFRENTVEEVFRVINTYLAPCLVVFEDIDLIAISRETASSAIIGPLLSALNGIEEQRKPIVIIGTTNRPDVLDEAVTRPCRFDRKIKVGYPTEESLNIMFRKRAGFDAPAGIFKQPENDKQKLTGAHIEEIYNTAAMLAIHNKTKTEECLGEAVEIVRENFFMAHPKQVGFGGGFGNLETHEGRGELPAAPRTNGDNPTDPEFFNV